MRQPVLWLMAAVLGGPLAAPCGAEEGRGGPDAARREFTLEVAGLAREAWRIDEVFAEFETFCDAKVGTRYENAREWFGLWERQVRAELAGGLCGELFDEIVARGEAVKRGMAAAESDARRRLDPAAIREVRRAYSLDWDGWTLPAPGFPRPPDPDPGPDAAPLLAGVLRV